MNCLHRSLSSKPLSLRSPRYPSIEVIGVRISCDIAVISSAFASHARLSLPMRCMTERRISSIDKASVAISSLPSELITFSSSPELTSAASFESFIILSVSRRVYHI